MKHIKVGRRRFRVSPGDIALPDIPNSIKGETGEQGPQGPQGDTGPKGNDGAKGDVGLQGLKGDTGSQGAKGDVGVQGIKGDTGTAGAKGNTGSQGVIGLTGVKGDTGLSGTSAVTFLKSVALGETATIAITAGFRYITVTGVTGAVVGDVIIATPTTALAAGYAVHDAVVTATGTVRVTISVPLIVLNSSYSFIVKLNKLN